ncbi:MAG: hypothetical protein [Circular genetic element sp.]|nr:MAG: hypothetical protein [Circular genetic element sp.]
MLGVGIAKGSGAVRRQAVNRFDREFARVLDESAWRRRLSRDIAAPSPFVQSGMDAVRVARRLGEIFESPWASGAPRLDSPVAQAALALAPHLFRMNPALRLLDLALLVRELSQQFGNGGSAVRLQVQDAAPSADGDSALILPEGWAVQWFSPTYLPFRQIGRGRYYRNPSTSDTPWELRNPEGFIATDAQLEAEPWSAAELYSTLWSALDVTQQVRFQHGWIRAPEPFDPEEDPLPVVLPAAAPRVVRSRVGLGAPNRLSLPRLQLGRLMLPGTVGGERNLTWAVAREVDRARAEFGLHFSMSPEAVLAPRVAHPEPTPWGSGVRIGGGGWQAYPPGAREPEPHQFSRQSGKTHKMYGALAAAYRASRLAFNAFTETNDFVRELHKALPKGCRKARANDKGNRRTDAMLRDLYRCWDRIDWPAAMRNLAQNQVQDLIYGKMGRAAAAVQGRIRRGGPAVGGQTGIMGGGAPYGGQSESRLGPARDSPIEAALDRAFDPVEAGIRAGVRAYRGS